MQLIGQQCCDASTWLVWGLERRAWSFGNVAAVSY